jgi:hypothetical protein
MSERNSAQMIHEILDGEVSFKTNFEFKNTTYKLVCDEYTEFYQCEISLKDDPLCFPISRVGFVKDHDDFDYFTRRNTIWFINMKVVIKSIYDGWKEHKEIEAEQAKDIWL